MKNSYKHNKCPTGEGTKKCPTGVGTKIKIKSMSNINELYKEYIIKVNTKHKQLKLW